jgi:hypothetical protein
VPLRQLRPDEVDDGLVLSCVFVVDQDCLPRRRSPARYGWRWIIGYFGRRRSEKNGTLMDADCGRRLPALIFDVNKLEQRKSAYRSA